MEIERNIIEFIFFLISVNQPQHCMNEFESDQPAALYEIARHEYRTPNRNGIVEFFPYFFILSNRKNLNCE